MVMKCANCVKDAFYEYKITKTKSVFYCNSHLPKFLEAQKRAGHLAITPSFTASLKSATIILATTPIQTVVEEVTEPVEEPTVEEPVEEVVEEPVVEAVEEPASVKKPKKKATPPPTEE